MNHDVQNPPPHSGEDQVHDNAKHESPQRRTPATNRRDRESPEREGDTGAADDDDTLTETASDTLTLPRRGIQSGNATP